MDDGIRELLHRNLQQVFGDGDAARRRTAIDGLYTEDCVLYVPPGTFVGREALDKICWRPPGDPPALRLHPARRTSGPPQCRSSGLGFRPVRRGARLHGVGCDHRSRWQDRGAIRVPRFSAFQWSASLRSLSVRLRRRLSRIECPLPLIYRRKPSNRSRPTLAVGRMSGVTASSPESGRSPSHPKRSVTSEIF